MECVGSKMKEKKEEQFLKKGGGVNFHALKQMQNKGLQRMLKDLKFLSLCQ